LTHDKVTDTTGGPSRATRFNLCEGVVPMGRGRAKAKQTKVARELKYRTFETDFDELQRELHGEDNTSKPSSERDDADDDLVARYSDFDDSESPAR
jgi:hypothetical protein